MFLIFLYFVGSCTERPEEYTPAVENNVIPAYTELTPDEYQKQMDEIVKRPPVTQTAFKSPILQAHASEFTDLISNYLEDTALFWYDNWQIGWKDITGRFTKDNPAFPSADTEEPVESVTVPFQYEFYGKNRVVYGNGTYEIIECRLMTSNPVGNTGKKTGHVMYRRTNQYHSTTSFAFDISVIGIIKSFSSSYAFTVEFFGLNSNTQGLTQDFISSYLNRNHFARFQGSSVNSLKVFNISGNISISAEYICWNSIMQFYPNVFSISSTVTNDYEFSQSVNNYYVNNKYWRFPNVYYNNNAGDTITQNNVSNYADYGYTYNNITNSIEFDPDVFAGFLDADVIPKFKLAFDDIFSHFPDIGAKFGDLDVKYTNIIDIMNEINNPNLPATTTVMYPVVTGDMNVNVAVDVTFPPEFYKTYPALTTEPVFVAKNPDIDYAFDEPLPLEILNSSGKILTIATEILTDNGLMPVYIMCCALSLVALFLL